MTFYELTREEKTELKERFMIDCVNAGTYAETFGVDWDEPSWGEIAAADELVPDEVIEEEYGFYTSCKEDFFCNQEEV